MRRNAFLKSMAALAATGAWPLAALAAVNVKMMIPANPGGGWDTTGRALGKAMQDAKVADTVTYENKGGAAFARASKTSACQAGDSRLSGASRQSDSRSASIACSRSAKGSATRSSVCMMFPMKRNVDDAMVAKMAGVKAYTLSAAISTSADQNKTPAPL